MAARRKSGRMKSLSLKAELNALVESRVRVPKAKVPVVSMAKNKLCQPAPSHQPVVSITQSHRPATVTQLNGGSKILGKRKRLSNEIEEAEQEGAKPAIKGCEDSVLEEHKDLCAMFPGRLFQIGILLRLLSGVSQSPAILRFGEEINTNVRDCNGVY